jgi:asparagine synthase (glutamine-hydrolysing)
LLLARDALGVKPLYFSEVERGVAFASELKSLIQLVPEVKEIDAASLLR